MRGKICDRFPTHMFDTLEEQTAQGPCLLHPRCTGGCKAAPVSPDFAVSGTPCHPFSRQRAKRFAPGSVACHDEFKTTFKSLFEWYVAFEPRCIILEQVMGFDMPEFKGDTSTPAQRPA